jgi:trk system potassium uptake protein TrkH
MGFCNAGFSLLPGSVAAFADDPVVLLTLAVETILGGIGFLVIFNLFTYKFLRRGAGGRRRLSLHARVTLRMTAILLAFAFAAFLLLEWNGTLAAFSPAKKCLVGFYHAVTPRTCGFSVVPIESLEPITRLVYEILMFIGGAPGSAAAGMKVTTFAVLLYTVTALCRNEQDTVIDGRVVPYDTVRESIVIFTAMAATLVLTTGALFVTESRGTLSSDALFFEAVSAVTTTGLSMGETTARLSAAGKIVVMAAMFFGRLGALTVVMMIGDRESKKFIRFPTEELVVG